MQSYVYVTLYKYFFEKKSLFWFLNRSDNEKYSVSTFVAIKALQLILTGSRREVFMYMENSNSL